MKKIFNKLINNNSKKYWIIGLIVAIILVPFILLSVSLTVNKRDFVLANYQSYISPSVEKKLAKEYGLSFDSFETVENAKKLLSSNTADIVATTSYELVNWYNDGLIQKLDWSKFNIGIDSAADALNLFTDSVQTILQNFDIDGDGNKDNLLEYGIPYFIQDFIFAYRGSEITELSNAQSWSQAIEVISNHDRFKPDSKPKLIAVDDARTVYSIPSAMEKNGDINPNKNETIESLSNTLYKLSDSINKLGNNAIKFNADANAVLNDLASNNVNGAFLFNGDALYASYGGDDQITINDDDFHIVKPNDALVALDLFVFNKNMTNNNLDKAYQIISELCLSFNDSNPEDTMVYENFDYVNYTCTLQSLYEYVKSNYFDNQVQEQIFEINNVNSNSLEVSIDNITKSNLSFAWINFKNKLH